MKKLDITGFKPFKVLWIAPSHTELGAWVWRGQCDCGNTAFATAANAKRQKSCGCITEEKKKYKDGLKLCYSCLQYKNTLEFPSNKTKWDKLASECSPCSRAKSNKWRKDNPDKARSCDLKKKTGITLEQKKAMAVEQNNKCAACGSTEPKGKYNDWHTDHNHATGKVRGLLCAPCNLTIGNAGESIDRLKGLIIYLEKHNIKADLAVVEN